MRLGLGGVAITIDDCLCHVCPWHLNLNTWSEFEIVHADKLSQTGTTIAVPPRQVATVLAPDRCAHARKVGRAVI